MIQTPDIIAYLVAMLALTNPFGTVGIFISLTSDYTLVEQRRTAFLTSLACLVIFTVVTWIGEPLLHILGISIPAFQLAGGLVITLVGLSMLQSKRNDVAHGAGEREDALNRSSVAVVPLAMPILAGPGAISSILVSMHTFPSLMAKVYITLTNVVVALIIWVVLYFAAPIRHFLGVTGISILVKIMGLLLIAIAMGMLANGLLQLLPGLAH